MVSGSESAGGGQCWLLALKNDVEKKMVGKADKKNGWKESG